MCFDLGFHGGIRMKTDFDKDQAVEPFIFGTLLSFNNGFSRYQTALGGKIENCSVKWEKVGLI